jgi:hypothetical protein
MLDYIVDPKSIQVYVALFILYYINNTWSFNIYVDGYPKFIYHNERNFRVLVYFISDSSDEIQRWKYREVSGSSYGEVLGSTKLVGDTTNCN